MTRVLIIGGYGNFGGFIAHKLAKEENLHLIIAGRSLSKATAFSAALKGFNRAEACYLDIHKDLRKPLAEIAADIVIHSSGPFQSQDYNVAKACIECGAHYIDLADGRDFVANIGQLNKSAIQQNVSVISGASSVPGLTSAVLDAYSGEFEKLEGLDYGITTAQKTNRGLATTAAILSYVGRPIPVLHEGKPLVQYGWQNAHRRYYPDLGYRWLGTCDIPDLELFPKRYPDLKAINFYAGLEIPLIHLSLWGLSWLVRFGLIRKLEKAAAILLRLSFLFDFFGTENSGFHMEMTGTGKDGKGKSVTFELTALSGDGPYIPCMPAILLTKKLAAGRLPQTGAFPCLGIISLEEYLGALQPMNISWKIS